MGSNSPSTEVRKVKERQIFQISAPGGADNTICRHWSVWVQCRVHFHENQLSSWFHSEFCVFLFILTLQFHNFDIRWFHGDRNHTWSKKNPKPPHSSTDVYSKLRYKWNLWNHHQMIQTDIKGTNMAFILKIQLLFDWLILINKHSDHHSCIFYLLNLQCFKSLIFFKNLAMRRWK